jgi:membrane protease YdiL (CAAX protease family)
VEQVKKVWYFYLLAFLISWAGIVPLLLHWHGRGWLLGLVFMGTGPAIAAWLTDRRTFLAFRIGLSWRWVLLAVALPSTLILLENAASRLIQTQQKTVAPPVWGSQLALLMAMALGANLWEETGWRCCGLRLLQETYRPWIAAGIVGVLWAAWHVPLFLWPGMGMQRYPFGWWALSLMGTSFVLAWLWNRTGGSVWGVTLYHVASNISGADFGVQSYRTKAIVDCVVAMALIFWTRGWLGRAMPASVPKPESAQCFPTEQSA